MQTLSELPETAPVSTAACCAVIVHYRCRTDLLDCTASLNEHAPDLPVLVIENGSDDGSVEQLRQDFADNDNVTVLDAGRNGGFGAGCNIGIRVALERHPVLEHVLLINPDTVVMAGFLAALRATAKRRPNAGIVGGRILDLETGTSWYENGKLRPWTLTRSHVAAPVGRDEFETSFVTGAMMLVDCGLLREGLRFDERYFLYAEDMDLCTEVRGRGRSLWVTQSAVIRHRGGGSQSCDDTVLGELRAGQLEYMTRGKMLFARKRLHILQRFMVISLALLVRPLLGLVLTRGRPAFLKPYFRGLWRGLRVEMDRDRYQ